MSSVMSERARQMGGWAVEWAHSVTSADTAEVAAIGKAESTVEFEHLFDEIDFDALVRDDHQLNVSVDSTAFINENDETVIDFSADPQFEAAVMAAVESRLRDIEAAEVQKVAAALQTKKNSVNARRRKKRALTRAADPAAKRRRKAKVVPFWAVGNLFQKIEHQEVLLRYGLPSAGIYGPNKWARAAAKVARDRSTALIKFAKESASLKREQQRQAKLRKKFSKCASEVAKIASQRLIKYKRSKQKEWAASRKPLMSQSKGSLVSMVISLNNQNEELLQELVMLRKLAKRRNP